MVEMVEMVWKWCGNGVEMVWKWWEKVWKWCGNGVEMVWKWCWNSVGMVLEYCWNGVGMVLKWNLIRNTAIILSNQTKLKIALKSCENSLLKHKKTKNHIFLIF